MKNNIKNPKVGFFLYLAALILIIVGMVCFKLTYDIFGYSTSRWGILASVLSMWFILFLLINSLFNGDSIIWMNIIKPIVVFLTLFAGIVFIKPCLSPIGIWFTVKNMGDTAAMEAGVPKAIAGTAMFIVSCLVTIVASYFNMSKETKADKSK